MKYIQDRLNGEGKVTEQVTIPSTSEEKANGSADTVGSRSHNTVNAIADVASCTLSFTVVSGYEQGQSELSYKPSFRDLGKLLAESSEDADRRTQAALLDKYHFRHSPTIFRVTLVLSSGKAIPVHARISAPLRCSSATATGRPWNRRRSSAIQTSTASGVLSSVPRSVRPEGVLRLQ